MNLYDERNNGSVTQIADPGFHDQDIEIGDIDTIVAPPRKRMGGWFPHPHVGRTGKVVDYQRRVGNNEPIGRVIELEGGDKHGVRCCVFDDRELRKGRM